MKTHKLVAHLPFGKIIKIVIITLACFLTLSVLFLLITPYPSYSDCFRNLEEIEAYAKIADELVPMDTDNTIRPEFNKYYNQFTQTYSNTAYEKFYWLFTKIGLKKEPLWSITAFKNLLERVTKQQETKGFKGDVIAKIEGAESSKFIVFGNIQGAFHSFTRCLNKLKELSIIDTNLKIIQPNHYIIFNGDLIDRSPFTIETLTVALKLIEKNPEYVIYIRGNHEEGNYWQEQTLKAELLVRATPVSKDPIPLEKEVNQFFNTLPLAVYISVPPNNTTNFVRIGEPDLGKDPRLDEARYAQFLQAKAPGSLTPFLIKEEAQGDNTITIKAIIKSEKKRQEFQTMEGLRLLAPDKGATAWNVLSCPTVVYATVLKFFHDAFAIVSAAKSIDDWTITLYARDRREKQPFYSKAFNFLTGTEAGKQADTKKEGAEKQAPIQPVKEEAPLEKQEKSVQPKPKSPQSIPQTITTITTKETLSGEEIPIMIVTPPNVVIQQVTVPIKDTEQPASVQKVPIIKQAAQPQQREATEEDEPEEVEEEQETPQKPPSHGTQHTTYKKDHEDEQYNKAATHHIIQSTITSVPETTYQEQPGMYSDQGLPSTDTGE